MSGDSKGGVSKVLYFIAAGTAVFSGMGQMPIMKRYYLSDLPLLGWSQSFYINSDLHYLAAALLLGLLAWRLTLSKRVVDTSWTWGPLSPWGWTLLTLLFISGIFKVARNAGVFLDPLLIMVLDFVHLGSGMAFMITGLFALINRSKRRAAAEPTS
jgi:hypothetical protein